MSRQLEEMENRIASRIDASDKARQQEIASSVQELRQRIDASDKARQRERLYDLFRPLPMSKKTGSNTSDSSTSTASNRIPEFLSAERLRTLRAYKGAAETKASIEFARQHHLWATRQDTVKPVLIQSCLVTGLECHANDLKNAHLFRLSWHLIIEGRDLLVGRDAVCFVQHALLIFLSSSSCRNLNRLA